MPGRWLRRLIPAAVISLVLAFSYFTPAPALVGGGSSQSADVTKPGADNNCGRFGTGYHDHDKVCPNKEKDEDGQQRVQQENKNRDEGKHQRGED